MPLQSTRCDQPRITIDETRAASLWKQYRSTRSAQARAELITLYMPFVKRLAQRAARLIGSEVCVDDLTSAGFFGLIDAMEAFDPERGINFRTFCAYRVRGAILDELRAMDWVPRLVRQHARQHEQAVHRLQQVLGRTPSETEVAEHLELDPDAFRSVQRDAQPTEMASLYKPHHTNSAAQQVSWADVIADPHQPNPMSAAMRHELKEMVCRSLSRNEKLIIVLYYYEGMTMKEIGRTLDLSESRVSQMHSSILARLRTRMNRRSYDEPDDLIDAA